MPIVAESEYRLFAGAPRGFYGPFANGHVQTLFPFIFRKSIELRYDRWRIDTPDGDFLDIDFTYALAGGAGENSKIVILSHGLEGHSRRRYIRGLSRAVLDNGWDTAAWNFRGCGFEMNRLPRLYHSGVTDDLHTVIECCLRRGYKEIVLAGVSMGANQILKYLGEDPEKVPDAVRGAAAFSAPCDLVGAATVLDLRSNAHYMYYFMKSLKAKVREKNKLFPRQFPLEGLDDIRTFAEFDERYTAPLHGFDGALDYWTKSSSKQFLANIKVPTLMVNAQNDPFLSLSCFPYAEAYENPNLFLEMPVTGGHMGFVQFMGKNVLWSEQRLARFVAELT